MSEAPEVKEVAPLLVEGSWEPSLTVAFLPRCANCHAPHPMARKPAIDSDTCPDCGHQAGEGSVQEVPAEFGGLLGWVATKLINIGRGLKRLAKEV